MSGVNNNINNNNVDNGKVTAKVPRFYEGRSTSDFFLFAYYLCN